MTETTVNGTIDKLRKLFINGENDGNLKEDYFDTVIGHVEDLIISEPFQELQESFMERYWCDFNDSEENKHCYMEIFHEYTTRLDAYISSYLHEKLENFSMDQFSLELVRRKDHLDGEVFEVLLTLTDFSAFKEMFLDYKKMKLGEIVDLSSSMQIFSAKNNNGSLE